MCYIFILSHHSPIVQPKNHHTLHSSVWLAKRDLALPNEAFLGRTLTMNYDQLS